MEIFLKALLGIPLTITVSVFLLAFLGRPNYNIKIVFMGYMIFYFITTLNYIIIGIPLIIATINILGIVLLTILYKSSINKKIFASIATFLFISLIEISIVLIAINDNFNFIGKVKHDTILLLSLVRLVTYFAAIIIYNLFSEKSVINLPNRYYLNLIIVNSVSILMAIFSFYSLGTSNIYSITMIVLIVIINFIIFSMYKNILELFEEKYNSISLENQYELIKIQNENIEKSSKNLRKLEHDLRNKLTPIAFMAKDENINISGYIDEIMKEFSEKTIVKSSGITELDSIINIKMNKAESLLIDFSYDICPIEDSPISAMDLAVIVGNLLDNAIEATLKTSNKWIKTDIRITKGVLIIEIENSFDGTVKKSGENFITRKEDKRIHGMGITNIKYILKKYDGEIEFSYSGMIFRVLVLVYPK